MKKGERVMTPRFLTVKIEEIYETEKELKEAGYTEPTHLQDDNYVVRGKSLDLYHMQFAAAKKGGNNLCR